MFNLIMAYDDSIWDGGPGSSGSSTFPLARLFEYTNPKLAEILMPVGDITLEFLSQLPCLFMSERYTKPEGNYDVFVNIRYGRVTNLIIVDRDVYYDFLILQNFGAIQVDNLNIDEALSLGKWEITRTHWAIKEKKVADALLDLGLQIEPQLRDDRSLVNSEEITAVDVPTSVPTEIPPVSNSVETYLAWILGIGADPDFELFYRGHSDAKYRLEPSLMRRDSLGNYRYLQNEDMMFREMITALPSIFASDNYTIDKLVRMQHYGLPTRLLDITSNPLVALYFCCAGSAKETENEEIAGEVILFKVAKRSIKYYDSDTVSCISNLSLLSNEVKEHLKTKYSRDEFNKTDEGLRLLHHIKGEKPYFKDIIDPADLERIITVKGRHSNERITSQAGAFLLFGLNATFPENGSDGIEIQRILIHDKAKILKQLEVLNIRASTIYPDVEKKSAEIARKYEIIPPKKA